MQEERIIFSPCDEKWMRLQNRVITITGKPIEDVSEEELFAILPALTNEERSEVATYKLRLLSENYRIKEFKFRASDGRPYVWPFKVTVYDPVVHRFLNIKVYAVNADTAKTVARYQFHAQFPGRTDPRTTVVKVSQANFSGKPWEENERAKFG